MIARPTLSWISAQNASPSQIPCFFRYIRTIARSHSFPSYYCSSHTSPNLVHAQTTETCYPGGRCLQTFTTPSSTGIQFGFAFPLSCDTIHTGEFIGQINAPLSAKWVGFDLGPGMIGNPLIVAWRYPENQVKFSVRQASWVFVMFVVERHIIISSWGLDLIRSLYLLRLGRLSRLLQLNS